MASQKPRGGWAPGTSGNPRGRPRLGDALAERVRRRVDLDKLIDVLYAQVDDRGIAPADRKAAAKELLDRGWGKAVETSVVEANIETNAPSLPDTWHEMTPAEKAAHLASMGLALARPTGLPQ